MLRLLSMDPFFKICGLRIEAVRPEEFIIRHEEIVIHMLRQRIKSMDLRRIDGHQVPLIRGKLFSVQAELQAAAQNIHKFHRIMPMQLGSPGGSFQKEHRILLKIIVQILISYHNFSLCPLLFGIVKIKISYPIQKVKATLCKKQKTALKKHNCTKQKPCFIL